MNHQNLTAEGEAQEPSSDYNPIAQIQPTECVQDQTMFMEESQRMPFKAVITATELKQDDDIESRLERTILETEKVLVGVLTDTAS